MSHTEVGVDPAAEPKILSSRHTAAPTTHTLHMRLRGSQASAQG